MKNHVDIHVISFSYNITIHVLLLTSCRILIRSSQKVWKKEQQVLVYASGLMKGAGGGGGGDQLINQILVRTRVRRIYRHCGLDAQIGIYPWKYVVLVGCNSVEPNLSSTGGEVEALNVGTFSGFCLACEASLRITAQRKTGQAAPERHNSRKKGQTCQNTTLAKL